MCCLPQLTATRRMPTVRSACAGIPLPSLRRRSSPGDAEPRSHCPIAEGIEERPAHTLVSFDAVSDAAAQSSAPTHALRHAVLANSKRSILPTTSLTMSRMIATERKRDNNASSNTAAIDVQAERSATVSAFRVLRGLVDDLNHGVRRWRCSALVGYRDAHEPTGSRPRIGMDCSLNFATRTADASATGSSWRLRQSSRSILEKIQPLGPLLLGLRERRKVADPGAFSAYALLATPPTAG
ncbi:hypothetical protein OKW29_002847 [Paraburkholderia sp. CI3]